MSIAEDMQNMEEAGIMFGINPTATPGAGTSWQSPVGDGMAGVRRPGLLRKQVCVHNRISSSENGIIS